MDIVECVKSVDSARILSDIVERNFDTGTVPMECRGACIVSVPAT